MHLLALITPMCNATCKNLMVFEMFIEPLAGWPTAQTSTRAPRLCACGSWDLEPILGYPGCRIRKTWLHWCKWSLYKGSFYALGVLCFHSLADRFFCWCLFDLKVPDKRRRARSWEVECVAAKSGLLGEQVHPPSAIEYWKLHLPERIRCVGMKSHEQRSWK